METAAVWTTPAPVSGELGRADPLGLRKLEQYTADWFWPGFSDRTTRAGYYPMVAYGLWVAEEAARRYGVPVTDDTLRSFFQRWERLWAMAVCVHHKGEIPDVDRMRGATGVLQAYHRRHGRRLPLDYPMATHERELGALGAYLGSLREHGFVAPHRLRVTPLGWQLASWMWDDSLTNGNANANANDGDDWHQFVLQVLDPANTTLPSRVGRVQLASLGARGRLSAIRERSGLQDLLWERLFADQRPGERPAAAEMIRARLAAHRGGLFSPESFFGALQRATGDMRVSSRVRSSVTMATALTTLGESLLEVFTRTCRQVIEDGYQARWNTCVEVSITPEIVQALHEQLAHWRRLGMQPQIAPLGPCGQAFAYTVERLTPQNAFSLFDSVLALHAQSQRALGQGGGWLARQGDDVFLRGRGVEMHPASWEGWRPSFRLSSIDALLRDLGQLE